MFINYCSSTLIYYSLSYTSLIYLRTYPSSTLNQCYDELQYNGKINDHLSLIDMYHKSQLIVSIILFVRNLRCVFFK